MISPEEQIESIRAIRALLEKNPELRILLVEDDPRDADLTRSLLDEFGVSCVWVDTCAKALQVAKESACDVPKWIVFLDLNLETPRAGLKLLTELKSICACKVVIMTGAYSQDSQECKTALENGALAVMLKPLTREQAVFLFGKTK